MAEIPKTHDFGIKRAIWSIQTIWAIAPLPLSLLVCKLSWAGSIYIGLITLSCLSALLLLATIRALPLINCLLYPLAAFWLVFLFLFGCAPNLGVVLNLGKTSLPEALAWMRHHPGVFVFCIGWWTVLIRSALAAGRPVWPTSGLRLYILTGLFLLGATGSVYINDLSSLHRQDGNASLFETSRLTELAMINDTVWPIGPARLVLQAGNTASWGKSRDPALIPERPVQNPLILDQSSQGITSVLVIGESQRADWLNPEKHPELLPELFTRMQNRQLLILPDVWSSSNLTMYAVPALMTGTAPGQMMESVRGKPSGLGYLKQAGFFTAFVSNHTNLLFAENGWDYYKRPDSAEWYDQYLATEMQRLLINPNPKRAMVLQMMGSHFHYPDRVPAAFAESKNMIVQHAMPFVPGLKRHEQQAIEDYVSSIAYGGYVLNQILLQLDQLPEPAILIFCSDHGENLYDDERHYYWHGGYALPALAEFKPAAFVAWNKVYAQQYRSQLQQLRQIAIHPLQQYNILPMWLRLSGFHLPGATDNDPFADGWKPSSESTRQVFVNGRVLNLSQLAHK